MNDLATLRNQLSEVTTELTTIRERRAALLTELDSLALQETELNNRVATLRAELQRLEPPAPRPQDVERLAQLTATLSAKLAKLPSGSPTGANVRSQLERLNDESVTVGDRLNLCRRLLQDVGDAYVLDRAAWDSREGATAARMRQ